jgi:hypothetical protein
MVHLGAIPSCVEYTSQAGDKSHERAVAAGLGLAPFRVKKKLVNKQAREARRIVTDL